MFSDTHCHLSYMQERGEDPGALIASMREKKYRFVLDAGTKPGDFSRRVALVREASGAGGIPSFIHFSCGLWPDANVIADRMEALAALETDIKAMLSFARERRQDDTRPTVTRPNPPEGMPVGIAPAIGSATAGKGMTAPARAARVETPECAPVRAADPAAVFTASRAISAGGSLFAALGECGLDRYWNGPQAAERIAALKETAGTGIVATGASSDDGPGTMDLAGEEELFGMQLDIARKYRLPVIVHSRDAFDATLACIRDGNWDSGVIHCFSYGRDEARAFLDRGWYISFPGNITWAKKDADKERIAGLVRYVPRDRLLLETDAPYLTPAPHRGKTNTPLFIEHTYARAASILGMETEALALLVFANAAELFSVRAR